MDEVLISHLNSGSACLIVGSGPSTNMGYPSWRNLGEKTVDELLQVEASEVAVNQARLLLEKRDYPAVFSVAESAVGRERLVSYLRARLRARETNSILYYHFARWPVANYLTTNYDDELQFALTFAGQAYIPYSNSEAHLGLLDAEFRGGIYKLHGDLTGQNGLILTTQDYEAIGKSASWEYWRTKMVSLFQMRNVVIIGHSLTDPNIKHVLEAARKGAGIDRPICWIAPNASLAIRREMLSNYRIHVISYPDFDGSHTGLVKLVEMLSPFVYQRSSIGQNRNFEELIASASTADAGAAGFFVYNKFSAADTTVPLRDEVVAAALKGIHGELAALRDFTFSDALEKLKWPATIDPDTQLVAAVVKRMFDAQLWVPVAGSPDKYAATNLGNEKISAEKSGYNHLEQRFLTATTLRVRKEFPALEAALAKQVAKHLRDALVGFFREHGLTLATILLNGSSANGQSPVPASILGFLNQASLSLKEEAARHAFIGTAISTLIQAEEVEREFLGRLAFGFIGFHALGVFGDVADERVRHAKSTVWLVDSNVQIQSLALMSPSCGLLRSTINRLCNAGVRLFSTERLAMETHSHLRFALNVIREHGSDSPSVLAAAMGQAPYDKSNQFLSGFLLWKEKGGSNSWEDYLLEIFDTVSPKESDVYAGLSKIGIEVVALEAWPGFVSDDFGEIQRWVERIQQYLPPDLNGESVDLVSPSYRKALPEAQAFLIIKNERGGKYDILGRKSAELPAHFISDTAMLNTLEAGVKVTWSSEGFVRFANTLCVPKKGILVNSTFDSLLLGFAQHGTCLINVQNLRKVFSGIVDAAKLKLSEQRKIYNRNLITKYGPDPEAAIAKLPEVAQPTAWKQLLDEMFQDQADSTKSLEVALSEERKRVNALEKELKKLKRYEIDAVNRRFVGASKRRKQEARRHLER